MGGNDSPPVCCYKIDHMDSGDAALHGLNGNGEDTWHICIRIQKLLHSVLQSCMEPHAAVLTT